MNNRELKKIIQLIQQGEGHKITKIATESGIGRSHLSTLINDEEIKDVEHPLIGKLSKRYPSYFEGHNQPETNKIDEILANLTEIRDYTIAILTGQSAGHEVMMGSLDRLEQNTEGTLSEAADRLALQIAERLKRIRTDKKAGVHK